MSANATSVSPSSTSGVIPATNPDNEEQRIQKLLSYRVLDTARESAYDDIATIAAQICGTSSAVVSLVDSSRQWFKSTVGFDISETPRDVAFCAHAILQSEVMVVPDAQADCRFANNPLVTGSPFIRFYAGAPLITPDGYSLGTLCVIDQQPRELTEVQVKALESLARQVVNQLETRLALQKVEAEARARKAAEAELKQLNIVLEQRVQDKTKTLVQKNQQLAQTLKELKKAQANLIHSEKIAALGQLVAGLAHEINNPVNFIYGNLQHITSYIHDLTTFLSLYEQVYPHPAEQIQQAAEELDIDFIQTDLKKILSSMEIGTERIREIVLSLRNFSRKDEADYKAVDIHEGIESTLLILGHRIKEQPNRPAIDIVRDFDKLPLVDCYAGQLNQVFMNILANAIDAIDTENERSSSQQEHPQIRISTECHAESVVISIADNGVGIPFDVKEHIFEPFFTTKSVGKGTGMGMAISHQLVTEKHQGKLTCSSDQGVGTKFVIEIPTGLASADEDTALD